MISSGMRFMRVKKVLQISLAIVCLAVFGGIQVLAGEQTLRTKIRTIVLPELKFRNVTVQEMVDSIVTQSRALDKEGTGVNIIMMTRDGEAKKRVTLSAGKATIKRALDLIALSADIAWYQDRNTIVFKTPRKVGKKRAVSRK